MADVASAPGSDLLGDVVTDSSDKPVEQESPSLHDTHTTSYVLMRRLVIAQLALRDALHDAPLSAQRSAGCYMKTCALS